MARLIKMVKAEPIQISVGDQTKYICGCGLSASKPYCDGSHELAAFEDEGKLYWYDSDGNCHEVADTFPKIPANDPGESSYPQISQINADIS